MLVITLTIASRVWSNPLLLRATCKISNHHQVVSCAYLVVEHSCQCRGCARSKQQSLTAQQRQTSSPRMQDCECKVCQLSSHVSALSISIHQPIKREEIPRAIIHISSNFMSLIATEHVSQLLFCRFVKAPSFSGIRYCSRTILTCTMNC